MKKEEKTKRTYEKILAAAIEEFGSKNYDRTSLTTICNKYQIPKGLLYHNFSSKDELYLKCVEACFHKMTVVSNNIEYTGYEVQERFKVFLSCRQQFFKENPKYANIFFNVVLNPPIHLKKEVQNIKKKFDTYSRECYEKILSDTPLRDNITIDLAVEYFVIFQEMFNAYFKSKEFDDDDFKSIVLEHEINLSKILDIILYGIIENKK